MEPVFISYIHENKSDVDRIHQELEAHGIEVWRDLQDLNPGDRWKQKIRNAIQKGAFFLACFSKEYHDRDESYMNEELTIAIDRLRQMPIDRIWFISIKLNDCELPDIDIGRGETLNDLTYVKLYEDWEVGIKSIVKVIKTGHPSGKEVPSSEELDVQSTNRPKPALSATDIYSEAIEITSNQNPVKWRQLNKQVRSTASTSLVQWGRVELLSGNQPRDGEQFVDEAVDIISPLITAALAGVESGLEHFKNQQTVLNNILNVSDPDLDSRLTWERIRYTLGYVFHSLHGALSINIGQIDLALDIARVKVQYWGQQNCENLWKASPFMGWSRLIGENHCTEGWKYLSSAYNRWNWLGLIFPDELDYRVSLVAYYIALNIHELAAVIASDEQETLETRHLKEFCVPLSFISEGANINQQALSMLQSNAEAITKLWSSLNVTRTEMEASWKNWVHKCQSWLVEVHDYDSYREVYHQHFFKGL